MSGKQPKTALAKATPAIPETFQVRKVLMDVQNDQNMPAIYRRRLLKQAFNVLFQQRQDEFNTALRISKDRLDRAENLARKQMAAQEETMTLSIREEFIQTMASIGLRVTMAQLEFLAEFGERIKDFRQKLAKKNIDAPEKKMILNLTKKEFERVYDKLAELTEGIMNAAGKDKIAE